MTATAEPTLLGGLPVPFQPGEVPEWLLQLEPGSREFSDLLEKLSPEDREVLERWLCSLTPDWTFTTLGYVPNPKQREFHDLPPWSAGGPWDALYGGAAGGGKTKGMLMDALAWTQRAPGIELWAIRATYPELRDSFLKELELVNYGKDLGPPGYSRYNQGEHALRFGNGSSLKFRHASTMAHAAEMLSASCQGLYIDERTTMIPKVLEKLSSRVRAAKPGLPIIGVRSGSNPGDIGHMDCKTRFIDPAPLGHKRIRVVTKRGRRLDRYFIPAKTSDNTFLDEGYEDRLAGLSPELQRAYLDGDWSVFEGMCFAEFRSDIHICEPEDVPLRPGSPLGLGIDYGVANPFCALWGMKLPDGLIVVYREAYKTDLTPEEQAEMIRDLELPWERKKSQGNIQSWLDPACWARQPNSPKPIAGAPPAKSIAAEYRQHGVYVRQAYNDRLGGKRLVHTGLRVQNDGRPRLVIYSTCRNLIRTLPSLPRDKNNAEDVDTNAEDHAYDGLRYLLGGLTGRAPRPSRRVGAAMQATRAG
jgi:hypothetical protein